MTDFRNRGVAVGAGALSTLATVIVVGLIGHFTGLNLFTISIFFIVPAGAALCGAAASSGFYFACLARHIKPGWWMIPPLAAFAFLAVGGIHYLEYRLARFPDGTLISDSAGFWAYLDLMLTNQTIRIGRGAREAGSVGEMGWWLAWIDLAGFVAGGLWVFFALRTKAVCLKCQQYLRPMGSRDRYFATPEDADDYLTTVLTQPYGSENFMSTAQAGNEKFDQKRDRVHVKTELLSCEGCHNQLWTDRASIWSGKDWKEAPSASQSIAAAGDQNLARFMRRSGVAKLLG